MRGRAHSKQTRTQANTINARALAFKNKGNSSKQNQCAGARTKTNRELKHTRIHNNRELKHIRSMRGRAHSKQTRTQTNTIDARTLAFKNTANSSKQNQCAGRSKTNRELKHTRIDNNRELKQIRSMRGRAHSKQTRTQANTIDARARAFKKTSNSSKHD